VDHLEFNYQQTPVSEKQRFRPFPKTLEVGKRVLHSYFDRHGHHFCDASYPQAFVRSRRSREPLAGPLSRLCKSELFHCALRRCELFGDKLFEQIGHHHSRLKGDGDHFFNELV